MKRLVCAFFILLFFHARDLHAQAITLGPYLQNVTSGSVVVRFELDAPSEAEVRYGVTDSYGGVAAAPPEREFEVMIEGLAAGEMYHYAVFAGGNPLSEDATFRTEPPPRAPFRLLAMGDTRSDHEAHCNVIAAIRGSSPHVWVHSGDMVSDGGVESQWRTFFEIETPLMKSVPQFGVIGNHDESGGSADNFIRFYTLPGNSPSPEHYYSFDYGNLHVVVLDGHVNVDAEWVCILRIGAWEDCFTEEQVAWIQQDLEIASRNPDIDHIFVFVHGGPYSSKDGRTGSAQMRDLLPAFFDYGVDVVISGHDHYYERGFAANGIPYVVSAGGGAPLYETVTPPPGPAHTVVYNEVVHHYTLIDVDWLCVTLTAYRLDGSVLDSFEYCSYPRVCVDPVVDCGTLPPSCGAGYWVCEAGLCMAQGCEGTDPVPDEVGEDETPETAWERGPEQPDEIDAGEAGEDASVDAGSADGVEEEFWKGTDGESQAGCTCTVPR